MSDTTEPTQRKRRAANKGHTVRTSPEALERQERDQQALQLRRSGVTWDVIAQQLEYASAGHAYNQVTKLMREYPREDIEAYRDLLIDRQELVIRVLTPKVLKADTWAIDRYLKACDQLARLTGSNRPEKLELSVGASELDAALRELEQELRARAGGAPVPQELPAGS